jgi:hypothetical protein
VVLMISESPGSVMASTLTRKYFPQAVPRSTLSAAASQCRKVSACVWVLMSLNFCLPELQWNHAARCARC